MQLRVITQDFCDGCIELEKYLKDKEVSYTTINASSADPQIKSYLEENYIDTTPTSILVDKNGDEIIRVSGFQVNYSEPDIDALIAQL